MGGIRQQRWLTLFLGAALGSNLGILAWRSLEAPLSTDEGYNLEVVDNLAHGRGYASYGNHRLDAWWSAEKVITQKPPVVLQTQEWPFDPRVTTGPAVLLPVAAVWGLTNGSIRALRISLWLFAVLYLGALWLLVPDGRDRLLAYFGAAAFLGSLWFGFFPGALLGELPGSSFFLAALVLAERRRWLASGFCFGLAFLSKHIFLLPGALAVGLFAWQARKRGVTLGKVACMGWGFLLPVAAFEVYRLASLGTIRGWWESWLEFLAFSREQASVQPGEHLLSVKLASWLMVGPGWALLAAALVAGLAGFLGWWFAKASASSTGAPFAPRVLCFAGLVLVGLWLFFTAQTAYRQALAGTLLLFPGAFLASRWWERLPGSKTGPEDRWPSFGALSSLLVFGLLVLSLGQWSWRAVQFTAWGQGGIKSQLEAAARIKELGFSAISPTVQWVEPFPVLTGLRVAPCEGPRHLLVVTDWARHMRALPWSYFRSLCARVIAESREFLTCVPTPMPEAAEVKVKAWGPQATALGKLPNPQPGGSGALWFQLAEPVPSRPKLVLYLNHSPVGLTVWGRDSNLITAPFPAVFVRKLGTVQVDLFNLCTQSMQKIGTFRVF